MKCQESTKCLESQAASSVTWKKNIPLDAFTLPRPQHSRRDLLKALCHPLYAHLSSCPAFPAPRPDEEVTKSSLPFQVLLTTVMCATAPVSPKRETSSFPNFANWEPRRHRSRDAPQPVLRWPDQVLSPRREAKDPARQGPGPGRPGPRKVPRPSGQWTALPIPSTQARGAGPGPELRRPDSRSVQRLLGRTWQRRWRRRLPLR